MSGREARVEDDVASGALVQPPPGCADGTDGGPGHDGSSGLRERKLARTRSQLTEAADRLFTSRGFGAVTVEDICSEVDVSPRTFFRYFHSKEDVVFDGIQPCLEQTVTAFAGRPASEDAYEALSQALLAVAGDPGVEHELLRVHLLVRSSPELTGPSLERFRTLQDELVELMSVRSPGTCTRSVARLLTAVAFAAFAATLDEWSDRPDRPLVPQLASALAAVRDGVSGIARLDASPARPPGRAPVTPSRRTGGGPSPAAGRSGSGAPRGRSTATRGR